MDKDRMNLPGGEELLELIRLRQSDRNYPDRAVEKEKLERILEAGRLSPSACNAQPWRFIVVDKRELLERLSEAASGKIPGMNAFASKAPVQIVVVRERANLLSKIGSTIKDKDYSLIDIGIAAANMCLQAEAEKLGSCMLGWFDEKAVKKILNIPASKRVELIITIGYPADPKREKKRKPAGDVISYNSY